MSDDLSGLGPQGFERLCQALATYVLGPGIEVFGAGPDGGREAAFVGLRQHYPASPAPWTGYGVLQVKFKERLLGTEIKSWLRKQVKAELTAWADSRSRRVRDGQRPKYLIVATNIPLSAVPRTGGKDRIGSLHRGVRAAGRPEGLAGLGRRAIVRSSTRIQMSSHGRPTMSRQRGAGRIAGQAGSPPEVSVVSASSDQAW